MRADKDIIVAAWPGTKLHLQRLKSIYRQFPAAIFVCVCIQNTFVSLFNLHKLCALKYILDFRLIDI